MSRFAIGLDYGTNSCRALLVNLDDGSEWAQATFRYPSGDMGVLLDANDPHVARQSARDYLQGLEFILSEVVRQATRKSPSFKPEQVVGIGIDTTGSTPLPVDAQGNPLEFDAEVGQRLAAHTWLWKDHTAHAEAAKITALARQMRPQYMEKCGGTYSSEWFWAKIWKCLNTEAEVFKKAYSWVELCDWLPAVLTGTTQPASLKRGICAAGHKAMFNAEWGGLPDKEFLAALNPELAALRDRLYDHTYETHEKVGGLTPEWAAKTGLKAGTAVAVGAFDAHMGAVGAGARFGSMVKIIGTSTCDIVLAPKNLGKKSIQGICGVVDGSVVSGALGVEAGQSAVGDLLLWWVKNHVPDSYGKNLDEKFAEVEKRASAMTPGQSGLLALDWNNGNRTILVDQRLSGLLVGQTLLTEAHEIFRALIEATAFGALKIIDNLEAYGVGIDEVIACGGLSQKNPLLMQIYADVLGRPLKVAKSDQTCALGAALFGAVAAGSASGGYKTLAEGQSALCRLQDEVYRPRPEAQKVYRELYALYSDLHDGFGRDGVSQPFYHVMKKLAALRDAALKS